jgi:hypothetical protein
MKERPRKSPPHEVEGPVRGPQDMDRPGTGGPYGHTVPKDNEEKPSPAKQGNG